MIFSKRYKAPPSRNGRRLTWLVFVILMVVSSSVSAQTENGVAFNQEREHSLSLGFSITSFSKNLTYQISPAYQFRFGRHQFMFNPFVGRLDAISGQLDIGIGANYRLFPFKNESDIRMFVQLGADYVFQDNKSRSVQALLYRGGLGVEADLSEKLNLGVNIDLGFFDELSVNSKNSELIPSGISKELKILILPFIRLSYIFGK